MSDLGTANCGCGCEGRDRFGGDCGCGGCNGGCGCGNNGCGFGNNSCLWMRQQRMWQRQLPVDHPSSLLLWWFRQRMRQWLWMRMLDNIIFPA